MREQVRKMVSEGRKSLTNSELIAVILGAGTANTRVMDMCDNILNRHGGSLFKLSQSTIAALMETKGVNQSKACMLLASLELAQRRIEEGRVRKRKHRRNTN